MFKTKNLNLVAVLRTMGYEYSKIENHTDNRSKVFIFREDKKLLKKIEIDFEEGLLKLDPWSVLHNAKTLKDLVKSNNIFI